MTKKVTPAVCEEYWQAVKELIDEAGTYAGRVKLRNNLLDSSTAWKVQVVLTGYYNNDLKALESKMTRAYKDYLAKVEKVNVLCKSYGLIIIKRPDDLLNILLDIRKRNSYKGRIKTKLKNSEICPLQDFEK